MLPKNNALIVIPCYSRTDLLKNILSNANSPILVVDDSPNGLGLSCDFIKTGGAVGFARSANLGLNAAQKRGYKLVLLLNDDALPDPDCIEILTRSVERDPTIGIAGPILYKPDGTIESAGIYFNTKTARVKQILDVPSKICEVPAISGACMMLRSEFRFDGRFDFGFEDIELCTRIWAIGLRVVVIPEAKCEHIGGGTILRNSKSAVSKGLIGHLRLMRKIGNRSLTNVVGLAVAQSIKEGGGVSRLLTIVNTIKTEFTSPSV